MTIGTGWMGPGSQVLHVLQTVGAETDEEGNFLVRGTISSFLGLPMESTDVVVGSDAQYRYNGQWASLALAMNSTSYGLRNVAVIS